MLMENARKMLQRYNPNEELLFGYQLKIDNNDTSSHLSYPSGGSGSLLQFFNWNNLLHIANLGYILSKKSVDLFVDSHENGNEDSFCPNRTDDGAEDWNLGFYI